MKSRIWLCLSFDTKLFLELFDPWYDDHKNETETEPNVVRMIYSFWRFFSVILFVWKGDNRFELFHFENCVWICGNLSWYNFRNVFYYPIELSLPFMLVGKKVNWKKLLTMLYQPFAFFYLFKWESTTIWCSLYWIIGNFISNLMPCDCIRWFDGTCLHHFNGSYMFLRSFGSW